MTSRSSGQEWEEFFGLPPTRYRRSGPKVVRLRGTWRTFCANHVADCQTAMAAGREGFRCLTAQLFSRISDERNLVDTWALLDFAERSNPGSTGFASVANFSVQGKREACKRIRSALRNPKRRQDLLAWEHFELVRPIVGRLITTAAMRILAPVLEPGMDPLTIEKYAGDARDKGFKRALKTARTKKRLVWAKAVVDRPIGQIPRGNLLDVIWHEIPNRKLIRFIEESLAIPGENGIRAGNSLSDLLLEFYLDRQIMRKWRKQHPAVPLVRSSAEFVLLCKTQKGAKKLLPDLIKLLGEAGLRADHERAGSIRDLSAGQKVAWLGRVITRRGDKWRISKPKSG